MAGSNVRGFRHPTVRSWLADEAGDSTSATPLLLAGVGALVTVSLIWLVRAGVPPPVVWAVPGVLAVGLVGWWWRDRP